MLNRKYAVGTALVAVSLSLALALPALADTNTPSSSAAGSVHSGAWMNSGKHGGMPGASMTPGITGKVVSISGMTLTVTGRAFGGARPQGVPMSTTTRSTLPTAVTYTVDATNATVTKGTAASTLTSVAVGDQVFVQGTVNGTSVTATAIRDGLMMMQRNGNGPASGIQGNGQPVVAGSVSSVNGSTFTLTNSGNTSYAVDASNATVRKGNATSTVANIASGDQVIVQGAVNGTSVTAASVFDQGTKPAQGNTNAAPRGGLMGSIGSFFKHLFGF